MRTHDHPLVSRKIYVYDDGWRMLHCSAVDLVGRAHTFDRAVCFAASAEGWRGQKHFVTAKTLSARGAGVVVTKNGKNNVQPWAEFMQQNPAKANPQPLRERAEDPSVSDFVPLSQFYKDDPMSKFSNLNSLPNLQIKVRKSDGERRRTASVKQPYAEKLAKANSPSEVAEVAAAYGINAEEIGNRAKTAPNFGQFRMVLGNRMRAIEARRKANPGMTYADAAYPKKAPKAAKATATPKAKAKSAPKAKAKVSKTESPAPAPKAKKRKTPAPAETAAPAVAAPAAAEPPATPAAQG